MQNELKKGDKIVTIGGLHGIVDAVDEGKIVIKCGDGSRLTYDRNAVRDVVESAQGNKKEKIGNLINWLPFFFFVLIRCRA